ncbi:MAG TPA: UDP-3-O-(3-hydroxymyristoyl)glucosamine N-acyltransferase, partial [bacterium]
MKISFSLERLAKEVAGTVRGDGSVEICGVAPLETAKSGDLTFVTNYRYAKEAKKTLASALLCAKEIPGVSKPLLISSNPYATLAKIMNLFFPGPTHESGLQPGSRVHPKAFVHPKASVAPGVTISSGAHIGAGSVLYPGVYIGENSMVGDDCLLYPNVVLRENCVIGNRVILQPGVVIGADGFGFAKDGESYRKIPQIGNVVLEDDVELGANTCVDRASFGTTRIGKGTKLDNLIQIGHNVA